MRLLLPVLVASSVASAQALTGGLARFRNERPFFPHAWQDHANTETAPGHATMLSGREPVHAEIVTNGRVRDFDARIPFEALAGSTWDLLPPTTSYAEPDSVPFENAGGDLSAARDLLL